MRTLFALGLLVLAAIAAPAAQAQDNYPGKTITLVVPVPPGGAADFIARLIGRKLSDVLGQPVVISNRGGASGTIASDNVAKAAPDGYTLLMATSSAMAINPTLYKKIAYDPVKDFQPIAMMAHLPFILVVNNDLPVKTLAEFIAYAKANPGKLSYGSGGVGASHHLYGELFKSLTGIQMTHVPYKGTVPALNDVIAGHIQVLFSDAPPALPQIKGGKVRALGVTTAKRMAAAPDIPPINDTVPFDSAPWQMLDAPAGTPQPIVDRLHKEMVAYIASAEGQKKLARHGADARRADLAGGAVQVRRARGGGMGPGGAEGRRRGHRVSIRTSGSPAV
jgi:tripartite-type tricarboxylate transporter receptor subunit TctC